VREKAAVALRAAPRPAKVAAKVTAKLEASVKDASMEIPFYFDYA
jgi:hypothetical protein